MQQQWQIFSTGCNGQFTRNFCNVFTHRLHTLPIPQQWYCQRQIILLSLIYNDSDSDSGSRSFSLMTVAGAVAKLCLSFLAVAVVVPVQVGTRKLCLSPSNYYLRGKTIGNNYENLYLFLRYVMFN